MADHVIAEKAAVIATTNAQGRRSRIRIREGKVYRSDDPAVQGREHLFRPVEDTSAAPGEKRNMRRPRRQAEAAAEPAQPAKAAQPKPPPAQPAKDAEDE